MPRECHPKEPLHPLIVESLRSMSPDDRLAEAMRLHKWGQQLVESGVRGQHSDWSEERINAEILRRMLGGATGTTEVCGDRS